jgi:hypothetical protein
LKRLSYLLFLVPMVVQADEVHLQGGGTFSGRIVEQTDTMITVDIGDGKIGFPMSRVERIVKGRSPLDEYDERASKLQPKDVRGWRSLGRWASQQALTTQSRRAYEQVISIEPDDAEAREALGFVRIEGRWLTEEESYRARGFVKYEGEWMTPAEMQLAHASAEAEKARWEAEKRAVEADVAAREAAAEKREAEERERKEEEERRAQTPVYWGGWGYGVSYWPSSYVVTHR